MNYLNVLEVVSVVLLLVVCGLLVAKRKNLGINNIYFLLAMFFVTLPNVYTLIISIFNDKAESSTSFFVVSVNFFAFLLFYYYFYKISKTRMAKKIQLGIIAIFILVFLIDTMMDKNFLTQFPIGFYFIETVLLLASITLFFYETFNSNLILNLQKYFPFWVSLSLIIIYVGLLPILLFIHNVNNDLNRNIYFIILYLVNYIGYGILTYGILHSRNVELK